MAQENCDSSEGEIHEGAPRLLSKDFDHLIEKYDPSKDPPELPPNLVPRNTWGAAPPTFREPLCTPVMTVLLVDTRSEFCTCEETCGYVLRKLQKHYMEEKGLPDIPWK